MVIFYIVKHYSESYQSIVPFWFKSEDSAKSYIASKHPNDVMYYNDNTGTAFISNSSIKYEIYSMDAWEVSKV